jgi:hypothetical protein
LVDSGAENDAQDERTDTVSHPKYVCIGEAIMRRQVRYSANRISHILFLVEASPVGCLNNDIRWFAGVAGVQPRRIQVAGYQRHLLRIRFAEYALRQVLSAGGERNRTYSNEYG